MIDMCSSFITKSKKYVDRIYSSVPAECGLGPVECILGHVITKINHTEDLEGGWKLVTKQGKSLTKPNAVFANILSKLGVANKAESKPKKKRKKNKKKKKTTVTKELGTTVTKEIGTLKKSTNFIELLQSNTKNHTS